MPIGDETIIEKIIGKFTAVGAVISLKISKKLLKAFFEELDPSYDFDFIDESKPLGTAGGISLLKTA